VLSLHEGATFLDVFETEDEARRAVMERKAPPAEFKLDRLLVKNG